MSKFDVKAYLSQPDMKVKSFDVNSYLSKQEDAPAEPESRELETFAKSAADSATLGYFPHLQALKDEAFEALGKGDNKSYIERRDAYISELEKLKQENPKSSMAGNVAGFVAPMLLTGGASAAMKGASLGSKALQAAKTGAVLGAVANPGDVEGEMGLQLGDRAKGAAISGALSGAAVPVTAAVSSLVQKGASKLKSSAAEDAYDALSPRKRFVSQDIARDQIDNVGQELLEKKIITGKPKPKEQLLAEIQAAKLGAGKNMGSVIDDLAEKEASFFGKASKEAQEVAIPGQSSIRGGIDRNLIADELEKELLSDLPLKPVQRDNQKIMELVDDFRKGPPLTIKEGQDFKVKLNKLINYDRLPGADIPLEEKFYRALSDKINTGVDDAAEAIAGSSGMKDQWGAAKKSYGALKRAETLTQDRLAAEKANRIISPSDYAMGGLGALLGQAQGDTPEEKLMYAAGGAALGGANRFGRKYGSQITAGLKNKLAPKISTASEAVAKGVINNPKVASYVLSQMAQKAGYDNEKASFPEVTKNSALMQKFRDNPALIDMIENEGLKAAIVRRLRQ